ncbi:hypothetical protein HMPREF6485_1495 [Segatella buccae ATCC 33574]|uniref:Uncharacterized protein n=1 Tax=Segatella buccae ATCC 33574 TaxID=873513 RepID=E6K7R6_9BACT|nr:hypothetical protein HMPREF6485_1495 [Segatella buccae ATCC 33574]
MNIFFCKGSLIRAVNDKVFDDFPCFFRPLYDFRESACRHWRAYSTIY